MTSTLALSLRAKLAATVFGLALAASPVMAQSIFTPTSDGFVGSVNAGAAERGQALSAGGKAVVSGQKLVPGQEITLMRGAKVLNDTPIVVDGEGNFSFEFEVDAQAVTGLQPIVVIGEKPAAAEVVDLKISPVVPISGTEKFAVLSEGVARGLYQVAYSKKNHALFVASAVGRPPVKESALSKVDPETLKVVAQVTPDAAPQKGDKDGGLFAAYGVAVDDADDTVWVTQTRQNTLAVYKQSDLSLLKQFEPGTVSHPRDVVVDNKTGKVYASSTFTANIEVFDGKTLEKLEPIVAKTTIRGGEFSAMALDIDVEARKLLTVSNRTDELMIVDLDSGEQKVFPLKGAKAASGVAYNHKAGLAYVASQQSDNLLIVNVNDGTVLHDVETGAGALNVTYDPVSDLAYVANRVGGTITVVNSNGEIVANLDGGSYPNQLRADGEGNVWAVNKSRGENDDAGDRIWKISPAAK